MIGMISDIGNIRKLNEDACGMLDGGDYALFLVCDGMGGHNAGEVASAMAKDAILRGVEEDMPTDNPKGMLEAAVKKANQRIYEHASGNRNLNGMGTTVTAVLTFQGRIHVAHVGDSALFRLRGSTMEKLTKDHSLVQELVDGGKLPKEDARTHPNRNIITRAVGTNPDLKVDLKDFEAEMGDVYLLATDGLTDYLATEELFQEIHDSRDFGRSAQKLVDIANERGGKDNITLLIFGGEALR